MLWQLMKAQSEINYSPFFKVGFRKIPSNCRREVAVIIVADGLCGLLYDYSRWCTGENGTTQKDIILEFIHTNFLDRHPTLSFLHCGMF